MRACAIVGGQFGSEGKGLIVGHIASQYEAHVRVGAANAGHTLYTVHTCEKRHQPGRHLSSCHREKHVMQQVPCAAYANPRASLVIGPGALISPEIFMDEVAKLHRWRVRKELSPPLIRIDKNAHVIQQHHIDAEAQSDLAARIGSTSAIAREGIGTAQAARVSRWKSCIRAADYGPFWDELGIVVTDTTHLLESYQNVLLEGTQGTGLSLTTGSFPYVTSRNTTSAGLAADCGVAPNRLERIIGVFRTYPIRVAGPSGPFAIDSKEIRWEDIGVDPQAERTTVTRKVRRVATFSMQQVRDAVRLNGLTEIALTFCDYLDPTMGGLQGEPPLRGIVMDLVKEIEHEAGVPVTMLGTGPYTVIDTGRTL